MLSREHRLTKQKDFTSLFLGAKNFQSKELVVKLHEHGGKGVRFGVVVSKKSAKQAVRRNRLKRIIRETLRTFIPLFSEGTDVAVITKPGAGRMGEENLLRSLRILLERAVPKHPHSHQ